MALMISEELPGNDSHFRSDLFSVLFCHLRVVYLLKSKFLPLATPLFRNSPFHHPPAVLC
jgi:hypothetical protein